LLTDVTSGRAASLPAWDERSRGLRIEHLGSVSFSSLVHTGIFQRSFLIAARIVAELPEMERQSWSDFLVVPFYPRANSRNRREVLAPNSRESKKPSAVGSEGNEREKRE